MLSTWLDFTLLTLFNAAVCVCLPRLLTLNWQQIFTQLTHQSNTRSELSREEVSNSGLVPNLDSSLQNQAQ